MTTDRAPIIKSEDSTNAITITSMDLLRLIESGKSGRRICAFIAEILDETRNAHGPGDIDGGWLQDKLIEHGLLEGREVVEPCGENCSCENFPTTCFFESSLAKTCREAGGK